MRLVLPGITPAWAGKSLTKHKVTTRSWDHPRVGGEKHTPGRKASREQGSPPRGRGKVLQLFQLEILFGITPAWAGKSLHFSHFLGGGKDHPRVGGEKA